MSAKITPESILADIKGIFSRELGIDNGAPRFGEKSSDTLARQLTAPIVTTETSLQSLGIDSLDTFTVVKNLETQYDIDVSKDELKPLYGPEATVGNIVQLVASKKGVVLE